MHININIWSSLTFVPVKIMLLPMPITLKNVIGVITHVFHVRVI